MISLYNGNKPSYLEIRIFLDEDDMYKGENLKQYILRYLLHHHINGASVVPVQSGFGSGGHLHARDILAALPTQSWMIIFIEESDKARQVMKHFAEIYPQGMMAAHAVEIFSPQKGSDYL
jgi:PII-like signaling protein